MWAGLTDVSVGQATAVLGDGQPARQSVDQSSLRPWMGSLNSLDIVDLDGDTLDEVC